VDIDKMKLVDEDEQMTPPNLKIKCKEITKSGIPKGIKDYLIRLLEKQILNSNEIMFTIRSLPGFEDIE